ncbi:MAG TPA: esterase [Flavobacteriaceae bacterium]|nr:esterase [Flavobacteriaceae bacterium]
MNSTEKEISYKTTNTYSTLNSFTAQTKNVWFVCHGMGYLSRYFLKYFTELNPKQNYIVAPQAQSKYYLPPNFKHVGSSWLTKENTEKETQNVLRYFDAVFEAERLSQAKNLIVLGFSQGVSVAMRYVAHREISCSKLVLMSGGLPKELTADNFSFLKADVYFTYGTQDEYLDERRIQQESEKAKILFGNRVSILPFTGTHTVNKNLINTLA